MFNPTASFLRRFAIVFTVGASAACAPGEGTLTAPAPATTETTTAVQPGTLTGQLVVHMLDFGGETLIRHTLRLPSGEQRELKFDGAPELTSGMQMRVQTEPVASSRALHVTSFEVLPSSNADDIAGVERRPSALINGMKKPTKKWGVVLVDTGAGVNITKDEINAKIFSDDPASIRSYYREVSYGLQDLTGEVIGPFKLSALPDGGLCNNFGGIIDDIGAQVDAAGNYDQYLWYFGSRIKGCGWEGVAQLGTAARPTQHSFYNASTDCVVLVQEPGHNFGMVHSSAIHCSQDGMAVAMADPTAGGTCTHDEYGNPFDPMGGGSGGGQVLNRCFHMNGVQKAYQDWLSGCNIVKATTSGTYTLYPLEQSCNGMQVLQVPLTTARAFTFPQTAVSTIRSGTISSYYVELRGAVGLDSGLKTPHVFLIGAADLRAAKQRGNNNWLIDTTPATRSVVDAALGVGKTFVDPAADGPKITLVSADNTKAVIKVELSGSPATDSPGSGTCSDDLPYNPATAATCNDTATTPPGTADGGSAGGTGGGQGDNGGGTGSGGAGGSSGDQSDAGEGAPSADAALASDASSKSDDASSGTKKPDAGSKTDATMHVTSQAVSGSCGCRLGGGGEPSSAPAVAAAGLVALLVIRRRRGR